MDRYGVIGNPVAHSRSPEIHAAFAAQTGQRIAYARCLAPLDGFAATVHGLVQQGWRGANVTLPFKLEAAALATVLSARARAAGAVNTLSFGADAIEGDNTDGAGLVADIVRNAQVQVAGARVLLLGAGGAARGALLPLLGERPRQLVIANRTLATAEELVRQFGGQSGATPLAACTFETLDTPFDIVINATSAGLAGAMPPLAGTLFGPGTLALDMLYGPAPSAFMQFAAARGACVRDGLGMLVEQAAEAFLVWRGVRPDSAAVLAQMRGK